MKKYFLAALAVVFAVACSNAPKNKIDATDAQNVAQGEGTVLVADTLQSSIGWVGKKPGGQHVGTLGIKSGELTINGDQLVAGTFVLDMNKIICTDLSDATMNGQLVGHLKSPDFFDVAKYPEGKFEITSVEALQNDSVTHKISGNLKLKDVEKNISFGANITKEGTQYKAVSVPFTIDRTQWGITYQSKNIFKDLEDSFINDNIEIQLTIVANEK